MVSWSWTMDDTAKHISRSQAKAGFRPVLVLLVLLLPFSSKHMFKSDKRVPHTAVLCTKCSPCALQNVIMCLHMYVCTYICTYIPCTHLERSLKLKM